MALRDVRYHANKKIAKLEEWLEEHEKECTLRTARLKLRDYLTTLKETAEGIDKLPESKRAKEEKKFALQLREEREVSMKLFHDARMPFEQFVEDIVRRAPKTDEHYKVASDDWSDEDKQDKDKDKNSEPELTRAEETTRYYTQLAEASAAATRFAEEQFPALKAAIPSIGEYVIPWNETPLYSDERHCESDACCTVLPCQKLELLKCWGEECSIDGVVAIYFNPIDKNIYFVFDELGTYVVTTVDDPDWIEKLRKKMVAIDIDHVLSNDDPRQTDHWWYYVH